jgi:ADP-heptose:LPS heptosyltransferase
MYVEKHREFSESGFEIRPGRGILFVDTQGLGDVVQSLPLLKAVCEWAEGKWPVRVLFATARHYDLVREEYLSMTPLFVQHLRRDLPGLFRLWLSLVRRSDLIVCAPEMSAAKLVLLRILTGARYAIGEASAPYNKLMSYAVETSWTRPFSETQSEIAQALGLDSSLSSPSIRITTRESNWAADELERAGVSTYRPIVGIQCSSAVPSKSWPAENFGICIRALSKDLPYFSVISFGTVGERLAAETAHRVAGNVPWLEATGKWSIRETLAMLNRCDIFISGDTGLMHMAAAVGARTISIFGPTSATRRAPIGVGNSAVCPATSCHPCFQGRWTSCECIRKIAPEEVISAVLMQIRQTTLVKGHIGVAAHTMGNAIR